MSFFFSTSSVPMQPPKTLGLDSARAATHEHGRPVPYVFGTSRLGITYLSQPWDLRTEKVKARVGKKRRTVGYNYFCSFAAAVCLGPINALNKIVMDDDTVWEGPVSRGVDDYIDITVEGRCNLRFYWGTETQGQDSKFAPSGIVHPGYRGMVYFIAENMLLGQNANTPNIELVVVRYPDPDWMTVDPDVLEDANPVAVIGDLWQNPRYGLGQPSDRLDTVAMAAAAAALRTETVGISGVINSSSGFREVMARIMENFDGFLARNADGKAVVRLVRPDTGSVPSFGPADMTDDPDIEATGWPSTITQVDVRYRDRSRDWQDDSVSFIDRAASSIIRANRIETIDRPWITRQNLAWLIAAAYCKRISMPIMSGRVRLRGDHAADLQAGDVFDLTFATSELNALRVRAERVTRSGPDDPEIDVAWIEDRSHFNADEYAVAADIPVDPIIIVPEQLDRFQLWEATFGWAGSEETVLLAVGSRGDGFTDRFHLWTEIAPDSYDHLVSSDNFGVRVQVLSAMPAAGELVGEIDCVIVSPDKEIVDATFAMAQNKLSMIFIGDEVVWVWDPVLIGADQYRWQFARARYGTSRGEHGVGTNGVWVTSTAESPILDISLAAVRGEQETSWKAQPELFGHAADLALSPPNDITLYGRSYRPFAPINLRAFDDGVAPIYTTGQDITVNWDMTSPVRCNTPAGEDLTGHTFADAVKLQILDPGTMAVVGEWSVSTTGPATITNAALVAALGSEISFILRAYSQRGGLDSLNFDTVTVTKT